MNLSFKKLNLNNILNLFHKYYYLFGFLIVFVYFIPYIILKDNSYIYSLDILDGAMPNLAIVANKIKEIGFLKYLFSKEIILENVMNGLKISTNSSLDFNQILYLFFNPLLAYMINDFIVRYIALCGMYLLLTRHILSEVRNSIIISFFISLTFCSIPFYSVYGLTVAGQPLLLYAFLNILKEKSSIKDFSIIIFFGFYSSFVLGGLFILVFLGLLFIYDFFFKKKVNLKYLFGLILLSTIYILTNFSLFESFFITNNNFISHRVQWYFEKEGLKSIIIRFFEFLFRTQFHTGEYYTIIIIFSLLFSFYIYKKDKNRISYDILRNIYVLVLSIILIIFIATFFPVIRYYLQYKILIIKSFQFDRFYFLLPLLWLLLFSLTIKIIMEYKFKIAISILILQFLIVNITNKNYLKNVLYATRLVSQEGRMTFKKYYDTELYNEIAEFINKDKSSYRVVSIGIDPIIATYNGFYTLDFYSNYYPLEYKTNWRKIIEKELEKNEEMRKIFDYWGNQCYIWVAELWHNKVDKITNLQLNTDKLKEMGGEYILSLYEIENHKENNLTFLKLFERKNSFWRIFLYKVN